MLSSGTVVVSNTAVTANSIIMLTAQDGVLNIGIPWVSARSAGVSFTISSSNIADARTIGWMVIEP